MGIDVQELVAGAIRWSGIPFLIRKTVARRRASILLYHDPAPDVLDRHLAYLSRRYTFISLSKLVEALRSGSWAAVPDRALVVTIDDGHRGNAALAPVLRRHGVVATIYACSQIVATSRHYWFLDAPDPERLKRLGNGERVRALVEMGLDPAEEHPLESRQALSLEEMRALDDTVEIGSHTRFHPVLTACGDDECESEVVLAKHELEELLGCYCGHFSYPNGDYAERELELVRRAGYVSARTVDIGWNGPRSDPFRLKILGTDDDASINRLASDLSGLTGFLARLRRGSVAGRHVPAFEGER